MKIIMILFFYIILSFGQGLNSQNYNPIAVSDSAQNLYIKKMSSEHQKAIKFIDKGIVKQPIVFRDSVYNKWFQLGGNDYRNIFLFTNSEFNEPFTSGRSNYRTILTSHNSKFKVNLFFTYDTLWQGFYSERNKYLNLKFTGCEYENGFVFRKDTVNNFSFNLMNFKNEIDITKCVIKDFHFNSNVVNTTINLRNNIFSGEFSLSECELNKPIDLTSNDFDFVKLINLNELQYNTGELYVDWNQFRATDSIRIYIGNNKSKSYRIMQANKIYTKLAENYKVQGNTTSYYDVLYELEKVKNIINPKWYSSLMDFFLGYGYNPLPGILFMLVLPIILTIVLFFVFRNYIFRLYGITIENFESNLADMDYKRSPIGKIDKLLSKDKKRSIVYEIVVMLYFMYSLIFGVRFKFEWIRVLENKGGVFVLALSFFIYIIGKLSLLFLIFNIKTTDYISLLSFSFLS